MRQLEVVLASIMLACMAACSSGGGEKPTVSSSSSDRISSDGRTHLGLAQSYLDANQLEKASQRVQMAQATDPGSADVQAMQAMIEARKGNTAKASRMFDRALDMAPADGSILNAHASWLCEQGEFDRADAEFNQALLDRNYRTPFQALGNAGKCAHKAGKWQRAEAHLRAALKLSSRDAATLYLLADTQLHQGKIMEAQAFIQRRDGLGSDAKTLELAARIEDAAGNAHAAARYRQRLKDEFPNAVPTGEGARSP